LFSLRLGQVDVPALASATAAALTSPKTPVEIEASGELMILADEERLQQALENVVSNAIKYSPAGKPVRVSCTLVDPSGEAPLCRIEVTDQGAGIPPELKPHLFDRFISGSGSQGLGLGLYLACQIAKAHGGSLHVESKPGEGATFRFELPISAAPSSTRQGST
jgi:signal transduction histidine kinase